MRLRFGHLTGWLGVTGVLLIALILRESGTPLALATGPVPELSPASAPRTETQSNGPVSDPDEQLALSTRRVRQGDTVQITITHPRTGFASGGTAWLAGQKAPLFLQDDGRLHGVMPVRVNQPPGAYTLKIQNRTGETLYHDALTVLDARFTRQNIVASKRLGGLQPEPGELEAVAALKTDTGPTRYWQPPFIAPTPDCMNSPFGNLRYHNGVFTGDYHKGLDLRAPQGRPVRATAGGVVKIARTYRLHGGTVGLDHGQGLSSIYIHLSRVLVTPGQVVRQGEILGRVGATGFATGPHLHWGLFVNGLPVNPHPWAPSPAC